MWIFQNNEGFFTTNNSLKLENNRLLSSLLEDLSSLPRKLFIDIVYLFARFFLILQTLIQSWYAPSFLKLHASPKAWTFMKPVFIYKKQNFLSNSEWAKDTTDSEIASRLKPSWEEYRLWRSILLAQNNNFFL